MTKILVVEDNPAVGHLMSAALATRGFISVLTVTGEEALQSLGTEVPELFLLDIHLPGMSGLELLQHLRADPRTAHLPVIAVTASVCPGEEYALLAQGFDACIAKPFSLKGLFAGLDGVLERQAVVA